MPLPADSHVHTEWSWDAPRGSMRASCERALELGLPAIAFTEHLDHTVWRVVKAALEPDDHLARMAGPDGRVQPPPLDVTGYLAEVEECRERFPDLRIQSGLELGEPHRHVAQVQAVLAAGHFDRVLGSLHTLAEPGGGWAEPPGLHEYLDPATVLRAYLAEVVELAASDLPFEVLAHIDYPVRSWPPEAGRFDPLDFEDELRCALEALAESGRALEVSTKVPLHGQILAWWREEGGDAITFASDAHDPSAVARGFREAAHMAEAHGFRPGRSPHDVWASGR